MTRRWWLASLLGLLVIGDHSSPGQGEGKTVWSPVISVQDPRMEPILQAFPLWESRQGPTRLVVDQVCLVPDLRTFLEAVASWDQGHYFPVLFDDVESSFRFIRAFRPARIIRLPRSAPAIPPSKLWDRATEVVASSWKSPDKTGPASLRGDQFPRGLGPTPPGVVFSEPEAPMLPAAVALAAGRFQPLIRLDSPKHYNDAFSAAEVSDFDRSIARKVNQFAPSYERLGDDCDFLTLAADYPFRYSGEKGAAAVDDRIGRPVGEDGRWAFAGRIMGDAIQSTYQAMCSLFLQPETALLFNTYDEKAPPWFIYETRTTAQRLSALTLPTSQRSDSLATLFGWHETFDPMNRFGLVMINSMGSPSMFGIRGRVGYPVDIPRSVPAAVLMIHSYSAFDPTDASTLAGRWLAQGAFLYFGSMDEPYVDAFRTPNLISELLVRGVPLVAAVRQLPGESRSKPWKLTFLGDPLYRLTAKVGFRPPSRVDRWEPSSEWPAYAEETRPTTADEPRLFLWTLKTALARLQKSRKPGQIPGNDDLSETLLAIHRDKLPRSFQSIYDALLIEILLEANNRSALKSRLTALPVADRSPLVSRTIETLEVMDFFLIVSQGNLLKIRAAWLRLFRSPVPRECKDQCTNIVAGLATTPAQRDDWKKLVEENTPNFPRPPESEILAKELKRIKDEWKETR